MNSLFPSTSLFLFKEPAREACCQRSHKEGFVPVFSWMFGTGLCRLGNSWSCAPGASSRRKGAEKFPNSQQAAGLLHLDQGICWSCRRRMQDPVIVPGVKSPMMLLNTNLTHKQILELFLLLRELWAVLFPPFRQNPCSQVGFFVSPGGACPGWTVPKPRGSFPVLHQTWRCMSTGNHFSWAAIPW